MGLVARTKRTSFGPKRNPQRFELHLCNLDPTVGREIRKTRPCLVISPDEMNSALRTVSIAPMTSNARRFPTRVPVAFGGVKGEVALDQIRTVDQCRLVKRLGEITRAEQQQTLRLLAEIFS